MKKSFVLSFAIVASLFVASCGSDDGVAGGSSYSFKNQNLQGSIGGASFTHKDGKADLNSGEFSISLYDISEPVDACDLFFATKSLVLFSVPNELGLRVLKLDFSDLDGTQTITLYDANTSLNDVSTTGAIEILTISATEVTGRIDARVDGNNFINGNFTATICN